MNAADGRYGAATHAVGVTLTHPGGATARDRVVLYSGRVLQSRHLRASLAFLGHVGARVCRRMSSRRIDCELWQEPDPDDPDRSVRCVATRAFRLAPSGVMFDRIYRDGCSRDPSRQFRARPEWSGPWQIAPLGVIEA